MDSIVLPIKRLAGNADLPLPDYATALSSGMDLYAAVPSVVSVRPRERELIPTGVSIAMPPGVEAQIRSRSGLALKEGVFVLNAPGTIDADYRGELGVILYNTSDKIFVVKRGMKIAQLVFAPVLHIQWKEIASLDATKRGKGGFGSTGV